ncbi:hypothetical protein B0H14DRAFT_3509027 [Mycena olivaceomarginata]|nr:hypothetical protein B0H14DRAFT_3509027 [Mycena olivaceomarginata]
MSRKTKATPSSSPLRPVGPTGRPLARALNPVITGAKSSATVALSKDTSPESNAHPPGSMFGKHLAADHPDTQYWLPFDNVPPLGVEHFLYTIYKVASAVQVKFPKPFLVPKTLPNHDLNFYLHLKPLPEVTQALARASPWNAKGARDASFGIPQVEVHTPTPPYHHRDPLDDEDDEDYSRPALGKGKGKAASATRKRARSPSDEESVPKKRQSRREAKPSDSDADFVANDDKEDHDELVDYAEETGAQEEAQAAPEECEEEEDKDKEEEEEDAEEASKASPKKAKAAPAAGPRCSHFSALPSDPTEVKEMLVEQIGHGLVTEAFKPPFLNKGPPTCTNCISRGHDCKPCITSRTNRCQRCHDGHIVCSHGRTALELLTSFERLCPILTVSPSALNIALISLITARRELDLQWIQLTRMSAQYDQQLQEVIDIIIQQNNAFDTEYVWLFYEDPGDREVLQGLLECAPPAFVCPTLAPFAPIVQHPPGLVPVSPAHPKAIQLTQETVLQAFTKPSAATPSLDAGPSTAPLIRALATRSSVLWSHLRLLGRWRVWRTVAWTAFISVLAAYEGVAKVEQLPIAVKPATLQTAIDRAVDLVNWVRKRKLKFTLKDNTLMDGQRLESPNI